MLKRDGLSKRTRFEVFKRDSFTCQYCGNKAPDVILHVDHIVAIANGGGDSLTNLITSCADCNLGKGDRSLSDGSAIQKQRHLLDELNERRLQLEMMAEWRKGLDELKQDEIDLIAERIAGAFLFDDCEISEYGRRQVSKWLQKFSIDELFNAIDISAEQYLTFKDNVAEKESQEKAFNYIPRICRVRRLEKSKPHIQDAYYIRGILRKRLSYLNEQILMDELDRAFHVVNVSPEYVKELAKHAKSWTGFRNALDETMAARNGDDSSDE